MKKHNLRKAFALSALMAFVITGSAYAESVDVEATDPEFKKDVITVSSTESFDNAGKVTATDSITVNGGSFKNTGTIQTRTLEIYGTTSDRVPIEGLISASNKIIYRDHGPNNAIYGRELSAELITPQLHIIGKDSQTGLNVTNNSVLTQVGEILVESHGAKTGLIIGSQTPVTVAAPIYLQHEEGTDNDARVEVYGGSSITANNLIALSGKTKFQLNNNSSAVLNNVEVKDGVDFSLQTLGTESDTAEFNLNTITVGDNAEFKTSIYGSNSSAHITGNDVTINLGENAKADFGGVGTYLGKDNIKNKTDWRGDKIYFDVDKLTINVNGTDEYNYKDLAEYKESYEHGVFISAANTKYNPFGNTINCDNITVVGASTNNTGNIENDLQRLAYVVKMTREYEGKEGAELPEILAPTGATVEQNPGGIDDGGKGTVDEDGNVTNIETIKNPDVFGTEEVGALGLISWRNELDDMNKRLGELRDSKGEHGVWVRMVRGENDYKSLNSQYNTYQLGYDEKLSTDPHWTLGAAFSYTDGDGGYDTGSFEMDHKTFTLYGSKLNDDGSYIDIVGKYSRLNHDLRNTWGDGEYDANGYSIGVEVGKRFQQGNGFWIEPQAQLTYGHVGSANYTAGDIKVAQDGMESLIGRAGVRFGKDLDNGNIYLRASYLYDFDGETGVTLTNAEGRERSFDQDLGGGWCEVGIGTNINLSDATHLYFDIEKTYGGDITTDWKWNAGIRYSF